MVSSPDTRRPELARSIFRGARINALGSVGKLLYPVFLLLITRIYGPSVVGVFLLTLSTVELASCIVIEGFDAGVVTFGSRSAQDADDHFYRVFASALQWSLALSLAAALFAGAIWPALARPGWNGNGVAAAIMVAAIVLPLMAFTCIALAATRARLTMAYDAMVNGFFKPVALIAAAVAFGLRAPTERSLALAYIAAQCVCAGVSMLIVLRVFSGPRLFAHVTRCRPLAGSLGFGMSSGVGSLSNALTANAPIVVLGLRGAPPAAIAFFGTALMIASNMRQIRFVFSTAFAPVAARLHAAGDRHELASTYSAATRWSLGLTLPVVLLFGAFRHQIMQFIHPSYSGDTTFILVLLLIPILRCSLAGTALLSSGYAGWSLFNNVLGGVVTVGGAWWLVPGYGVLGAAAAAAVGVVVITIAELAETRRFLKLRLDLFERRHRPGLREGLQESDRSSPYPGAPC